MKKLIWLSLFAAFFGKAWGQESYFMCDETSVRLLNGSIQISTPNLSKQDIEKRLRAYIKERNYAHKPFYSTENVVAFRDFAMICNKSACGSDLYAKNIFYLRYGDGSVKINLKNEIYSSFHGAELVINENDDVASKRDVPFGTYEFEIPDDYSDEYPESIYSFNQRGKSKVKNPKARQIILDFYNRYIADMKAYLEK